MVNGRREADPVSGLPDIEAATTCSACPLRPMDLFINQASEAFDLVKSLKRWELRQGADETRLHEGRTDAPLYTRLHGWAFHCKTLSDGRRQIQSFLLGG